MSLHHVRQRIAVIVPGIARVAVISVIAIAVAEIYGETAGLWVAVAGFGYLLIIHFIYVGILGHWLENQSLESIPSGIGSWSNIFTRLYRARRASEANERRLIENEERFRRTISALPEGIVLLDAQLQIDWCNPVAERHLGIELRRDHGLRLLNLVRDPAFIAYINAGNFDQPLVFRPLGNAATILAITVIDFEAGRSILISRDITQTERLDAMRRDFIANVSHELRTPLTVVNGFLEILLDAQPLPDDVRRYQLKLMHEQATRMQRLVQDLLTLSRLESSETPLVEETIDLRRVVADLEVDARALSHQGHVIEVEAADVQLRGNRDELFSAFGNLVSNAVRYTPEGGHIRLRCHPVNDGFVFEVEDSGPGIAPEHLPRLTERFYRIDKSRSRETGGTGLGLAIVKHVLIRHQGRLDIHSQVGRGSTFTAWLPRTRIVEPSAP